MKKLIVLTLLGLAIVACTSAERPEVVQAPVDVPVTARAQVSRLALATEQPTSEPTAIPGPIFRIIDGDTVEIEQAGKSYVARLIGIDTPEEGQPGSAEASDAVKQWLSYRTIMIEDSGRLDKYDRHLIYLRDLSGADLGLFLITNRFAIARYDSRDGYDWHELEDAYHAADAVAYATQAPTATLKPAPTQGPTQRATVRPQPTAGSVYYANCSAARAAGAAPIYRGEPGYRSALDRDDDGVACEG